MQNLNLVSGKDEKIISFIDSIKPWILVANDDCFLLQMIEGSLENDFQVDLAENGLQAYELVKKHGREHYKAIVLDINMPIMDGIDACNKIYSYLSQEDLISNMKIESKILKNQN
jgi:CheY-like chemotaxis protein